MCQLYLTSMTNDSKNLLIETVIFWNRYAIFQDQAWTLDFWSINILTSSWERCGMYVKTQLFIIVIIYTCHMINVPVQILFSSNKKLNENRQ